jgi:hypothetical protein
VAPAHGGPRADLDHPVTGIAEICHGMTNVVGAEPEVVTLCHGVTIGDGRTASACRTARHPAP